jgi:hypothetical protein
LLNDSTQSEQSHFVNLRERSVVVSISLVLLNFGFEKIVSFLGFMSFASGLEGIASDSKTKNKKKQKKLKSLGEGRAAC